MTVTRRSFIERLGLGAAAGLLSPVAQSLVAQAQGQAPARRRLVVVMVGNGVHYDFNFTPPELRDGLEACTPIAGATAFTWPVMLRALEPRRPSMLLLDGLSNSPNRGRSGHSCGYSWLSCTTSAYGGDPDTGGRPGGPTFDQVMGGALVNGAPFKSVLYGTSTRITGQTTMVFASDFDKPEPHYLSPRLMYNDLFGALVTDGNGARRGLLKQQALLDLARADIARLAGALAPAERRALDHYLGALDEMERRNKALASVTCKAPAPAMLDATQGAPEDRLEAMTEIAAVMLGCNLTSVVGVSVGTGFGHGNFPPFKRLQKGTRFESEGGVDPHGHDGRDVHGAAMDIIHGFNTGLIGRIADVLAGIREGDGTALDNTVFMYMSDNGEQHHANHDRCPIALLAGSNVKLRTGGRFVRYPKGKASANRTVADLYCTVATLLGVPMKTFGNGTCGRVQGPIAELMA